MKALSGFSQQTCKDRSWFLLDFMRFYSGQTKEPSQTTIVFSDRVGWVSALLRPALVSVAGSHATAISDVCLFEAPNREKKTCFWHQRDIKSSANPGLFTCRLFAHSKLSLLSGTSLGMPKIWASNLPLSAPLPFFECTSAKVNTYPKNCYSSG